MGKMIRKLINYYQQLDSHKFDILTSSMNVLVLRLVGAGAQFLFFVLLGRYLGAEGIGLYVLSLTIVTVTMMVARIGLDQAMMRFSAVYFDNNDWKGLFISLRESALVIVATSSVLIACIYFSASWVCIHWFSKPDLVIPMKLMSFAVLPLALIQLLAETLRGIQHIRASTLLQAVAIPVLLCSILYLLKYLWGVSLIGVAATYLGCCLLVFMGGVFYWWRLFSSHDLKASINTVHFKDILSVSTAMAWVAFLSMGIGSSETLILGIFQPSEEVGIYNVALKATGLLAFVAIAGNAILASKVSIFFHSGNFSEIERLARFSVVLMLSMALPLFLLYFFAPSWVMGLFGQEFGRHGDVLLLLSVGQLINVAGGPVGVILMMTGHERVMWRMIAWTLMIQVALGIWLIPAYGAIGAGVSATLGLFMINAACLLYMKRKMNITLI